MRHFALLTVVSGGPPQDHSLFFSLTNVLAVASLSSEGEVDALKKSPL